MMRSPRTGRGVAVAAGLIGLTVGTARSAPPVDFSHDIVPIIKARCAECHTNGKYKGSFSLDTREDVLASKAVVPGKSGESELYMRIITTERTSRMPNKGEPLTPKQVALVKAWIDEGFKWEDGFNFKAATYVPPLKPRRVKVPPAREGLDHPIDPILAAYRSANKLPDPAPLDDAAFARRLYLDLVGQLPASSEVEAFVADGAADKRAKLARRLLAEDRNFAEHW